MATQGNLETFSFIAGADLSAAQFKAVKVTSSGVVLAGDGEAADGVLQNNPKSGQSATVAYSGLSKFIAGGNVSIGDFIASDANGKAKTAVKGRTNTSDAGSSTDALVGSFVLGKAFSASAADGTVITVLLHKSGAVPTTAA